MMAFYDNKLWLLSHIHNSFITSDDSGVCQMVLGSSEFKEELRVVARNQGLPSFTDCITDEEDDDDDIYRRSPDIRGISNWAHAGASPAGHKQTSGAKPEKLKPDPPKTKTVVWKQGGNPEAGELETLFPRKEISVQQAAQRESKLSHLLDNLTAEDSNPWLEYGRFDATGHPDAKMTRFLTIYYPMTVGDSAAAKPIHLSCNRDAKVYELIGLACYKYSLESRVPALLPPVDNYSLFMCEEDGAVDIDFPALDPTDALGKYGFDILALGERSKSDPVALCVTLHMPDGTFSQIEVQRKDITMGELTEKGLERRKYLTNVKYNFGYHLEAVDDPGVALEPSMALNSHSGTEFFIVRNNSKRASGPCETSSNELCFLEAPLFQSFNVDIFTKVRTKVDIHLGISGDKVEIDPRQQTSSAKFWSKQKAVSYPMDVVVSCEILENKQKGNRDVFRMVYLSDNGWGQRDFEANSQTAAEVVQKMNYLLDLKQSTARKQRKEYLQNKEKKKERLRTLTK